MGFQVSFSIAQDNIPITYGFAGLPQYATCSNGTTLSATIWGRKTESATVLWEQIAGPSVVWLTPTNQLTVSFLKNPNPLFSNLDLQFRFWVNKGKPRLERYSDVWVYSTPTVIQNINSFISPQIEYSNLTHTSNITTTTPEVVQDSYSSNYFLRWNYTNTQYLQQYSFVQAQIQQFVNNQWITIGSAPYPQSSYFPVSSNGVYRIVIVETFHDSSNNTQLSTHNIAFVSRPSTTSMLVNDQSNNNQLLVNEQKLNNYIAPNSPQITNFDVIERTLFAYPVYDLQQQIAATFFSINTNNITGFNVVERELTSAPLNEIYSSLANSIFAINTLQITNFNVQLLGGVVIGG